jgi:hypothetical protein
MDGWIDRDDVFFFVASVIHKFHADVSDCVNNILPHHRLLSQEITRPFNLKLDIVEKVPSEPPHRKKKEQEELLRSETPVRYTQ